MAFSSSYQGPGRHPLLQHVCLEIELMAFGACVAYEYLDSTLNMLHLCWGQASGKCKYV